MARRLFRTKMPGRPFTSIVTAMRAEPSFRPAGAVGTHRSRRVKQPPRATRVHRRTEILRNRPTQFGRQNAACSHFTHMISFFVASTTAASSRRSDAKFVKELDEQKSMRYLISYPRPAGCNRSLFWRCCATTSPGRCTIRWTHHDRVAVTGDSRIGLR